jgi:hypothetical protein
MSKDCEKLYPSLRVIGLVIMAILIAVIGFFTGIGIGWAIDNF